MNNTPNKNMTDQELDAVLAGMASLQPPVETAEAARESAWRKIAAAAASPVCAEFQRELPAYMAGTLEEARRLLADDHLSRCPRCRQALAEARQPASASPAVVVELKRRPKLARIIPWAAAATLAAVSVFAARDSIDRALAPGGPRAHIESAAGRLQLIAGGSIEAGNALMAGQTIRTASGGHAVLLLADGSRVEMNERTELAIESAWSGETIRLTRGDVIVEAAKQHLGRLRVATPDSVASVKGTVFSVSADAGGSVVAVAEGAVAVTQPGVERLLKPGENSVSNPALAKPDTREVFAWSQDSEKYASMLAALMRLEADVAALPQPALRTDPKLLRYLPAGSPVYAAFPNLSGTIGQALTLLEQRAAENIALGEWWRSPAGLEVKKLIQNVQSVTPYLREEIVVMEARHDPDSYSFLAAQVRAGQQAALTSALDALAGGAPPYRISGDLLLVAEQAGHLNSIQAQLGTGAASAFAADIRARYATGAGWLVALDVSQWEVQTHDATAARMLGIANARTAVFEQRSAGNMDDLSASLNFGGARSGIASWLAAPGTAGSTEYVSAEAQVLVSGTTRNPRQSLEELLQLAGADFVEAVLRFERETGLNLRADIAGSLGTDFSLAIERFSLPVPGWVGVAVVLQPSVLDNAIRRLVETHARLEPAAALIYSEETANGRQWRLVRTPTGLTIQWTYDRGYLIVSTDRALALGAISVRDSGLSLTRSTAFRQAIPNGNLHHSAYLWFNVSGVAADAAALLNSPALRSIASSRTPVLVVLDGETEQIRAASRSRLTSLVLDLLVTHAVPVGTN